MTEKKRKLLIILGGVFIVVVVAPLVTYQIWQMQARAAISAFSLDNAELTEMPAVPSDAEAISIPKPTEIAEPPSSGRVTIASANITMPIYNGDSASLLYWGAWRSPWNDAVPGEAGNVVLFGHRWLKLPPSKNTMWNLDKVQAGERIEVQWGGETYSYEVTGTEVVAPTDISVLNETDEPTLTLITCTPVFTTKERLIVTARLIE